MSEPEAGVTSRRRVSAVWIVPVLAMLLGVWLVIDAYLRQGPEVEITFATADGIEEDTTPVKVRNVQVGTVSEISLSDDLDAVKVTVELTAEARRLLREDTSFWVVRPRVSRAGISGLGTIVSGAYIEIAPGIGEPTDERQFEGLDQPPPTPAGTPGLRVNLVSETSGALGVGDPVLYRGYPVGRVESSKLDVEAEEVRYSVFIDAPYDELVSSNTRFWNASGISAELTTEGATISVGSFETLIAGGVAFDLPESATRGEPARADETFQLYADEADINANPYRYGQDYVVSFSQSVRGLSAGAPVTLRGIRIGNVRRIMVREGTAGALDNGTDAAVPVLIRIEPGRLEMEDSREGLARLRSAMEQAVASGLRGTLESGNLITGSLYVNFDFFANARDASLDQFEGVPHIPTISGGLARMQQQVGDLLAKLNALPLEETVASTERAVTAIEAAAGDLQAMLGTDAARTLPAELQTTLDNLDRTLADYSRESGLPDRLADALDELESTLRSVEAVADRLERQPNALIFPSRSEPDPQPRAGEP